MQFHNNKDKIIIIDFGSQVTKLIARRIRDFGVYSEIITPNLTFSTTVSPIFQLGLVPRFIGVEKNKFVANVEDLEKAINKKTVAIMIPNLLGNIANWSKINLFAKTKFSSPKTMSYIY